MKRGVEDLGHSHIVPQRRPRSVDPSQTGRVVQRRQLAELFDLGHDGRVDADRLLKVGTPMDYAMADGLDLTPLATVERPPNSLVVVPNVLLEFQVRHGIVIQAQPRQTADAIYYPTEHDVRRLMADVYNSEFQA